MKKKKKNKLRNGEIWCSTRLNIKTISNLLYVKSLKNTSNILDPIMFAGGTNLFFTHQDIRYLFQIVDQEVENLN